MQQPLEQDWQRHTPGTGLGLGLEGSNGRNAWQWFLSFVPRAGALLPPPRQTDFALVGAGRLRAGAYLQ
jgi:hypothetical protein